MTVARKRRVPTGEVGAANIVSLGRTARASSQADAAPAGLRTARVLSIGDDGAVELDCRGAQLSARVDPSVHPAVVAAAQARGEAVLVEVEGGEALVVGALRTQPALGSDPVEEIDLRASRIRLSAERVELEGEEVTLSSKTARVVLRAAGEIESFADRIVSRASGVHKIVGRMLRLN